MNKIKCCLLICLLSTFVFARPGDWLVENHGKYNLHYNPLTEKHIKDYQLMLDEGIRDVEKFMGDTFQKPFDVFIYPERKLLDAQWQQDWKMPSFTSECWMVASGVAAKLDMLSPAAWSEEACEHDYSDKLKTQQLLTHELVHVYHGQRNVSPDFSDVQDMDWFVEGLANYASGQCDAERMKQVKKALEDKTAPDSLNNFWTGKMKYGLSGSMVMFIDNTFGRQKLKELLPLNKKTEVLTALKISEAELITGWKKFVEGNKN